MSDYMTPEMQMRIAKLMDQIPNITQAMACCDCTTIYRYGAVCPRCGSNAVWNVAGILSGKEDAVHG